MRRYWEGRKGACGRIPRQRIARFVPHALGFLKTRTIRVPNLIKYVELPLGAQFLGWLPETLPHGKIYQKGGLRSCSTLKV
jgi:hypothetical protein